MIESGDELCALQDKASHRFIHPTIMDWPDDMSTETMARLPFMGWSADTADNVVKKIRRQFFELRERLGGDNLIKLN